MNKKVIVSGVAIALLLGIFYAHFDANPSADSLTGFTVAGQSRYAQLKACVDGGQDLSACRLAVGILSEGDAGGGAGGQAIAGAAVVGLPSPEGFKKLIHTVWQNQKPYIVSWIHASFTEEQFANSRTRALYDLQYWTNNLLVYAAEKNDIELLDELAGVYLLPLQYLLTTDTYEYAYLPEKKPGPERAGVQEAWTPFYRSVIRLNHLPTPSIRIWSQQDGTPGEHTLDVGQFLYVISDALAVFLDIPENQRTENMRRFIREYGPVVVAHYQRWVFDDTKTFQLKGWQCDAYGTPNDNHYGYVTKLRDQYFRNVGDKENSLCNMFTDIDLWITVGVVKMLAANQEDPRAVHLSDEQVTKFKEYVGVATQAIQDRMNPNQLTDFQERPVVGFNFEQERGNTHPDNDYTSYGGSAFPTEANKARASRLGWDLGHATRIPTAFITLYNHKDLTGQSFPTRETMTKLSNQYLYGAFNKDLQRPLFHNFFSGANGWYRVNYENKPGSGYPPFSFGFSGATSYLFLLDYAVDRQAFLSALWGILTANMVNDESGNGHLATGWQVSSNAQGRFGGSLIFDDNQLYNESLWCGKYNDWAQPQGTFAFWTKTGESADMDILDLWETPYTDFFLVRKTAAGTIWLFIKDGNNGLVDLSTKTPLEGDGWHHIVITQDGSGIKIYVDGSLSETTGPNNGLAWTSHLNMYNWPDWKNEGNASGCYLGNSHWYKFRGELDEIYFFNRALSAEETQQLYQANNLQNKGGLLSHWSFDELLDPDKVNHKAVYYGPRGYSNYNLGNQMEGHYPDKSRQMLEDLPAFALANS